jgi:hypothetical protein
MVLWLPNRVMQVVEYSSEWSDYRQCHGIWSVLRKPRTPSVKIAGRRDEIWNWNVTEYWAAHLNTALGCMRIVWLIDWLVFRLINCLNGVGLTWAADHDNNSLSDYLRTTNQILAIYKLIKNYGRYSRDQCTVELLPCKRLAWLTFIQLPKLGCSLLSDWAQKADGSFLSFTCRFIQVPISRTVVTSAFRAQSE